MALTQPDGGRFGALAPAALLLLALCLLASGAQGADVPRYVVGDVLEIDFAGSGATIVIEYVDTTSLAEPYYHTFLVVQNAGRWEIPRYWHNDLDYTESELVVNNHARRVGHVDPVKVIIADHTITGGDMVFYGLSLAEAKTGGAYWVEQRPGESTGSPYSYVPGDILGNVSDPDRGWVISSVYESDGAPWARVYFDAVRSGDRWILDTFYNDDMGFPMTVLGQNESRRVAHADLHTVIINDTTTNTGEIGWYRLSLAEFLAGKNYDWMGPWHFNTGDILSNGTATRYIVGSATISYEGPSHYTLYEVVRTADGWEIPRWVNAGIPSGAGLTQPDGTGFDLVDHTDPHFAVVTDPSVENGLTFNGLSLGEILEGTPGYPPESPGPVGGDTGYFLVSTTPAGASIYLEDFSGTRTLQGNTSAGSLNVTILLTATPARAIVANLSGYREAVFNVTQYPAKGQTLPVALTLERAGGPTPFKQLSVPGRVQAEDYDLGGEGVAYHDTTPGNTGGAYRHDDVDIETGNGVTNVGWIRNGEYLVYTVNVSQNGTSAMTASVASPNSGRTMELLVDGSAVATIAVPNTGSFATFRTVEVPVTLAAGTHTLKLAFQGDGQNLDWIEFDAPAQTPCGFADAYPRPNFTVDPTGGAAPLTVRFTDTSSEFAYDWNWSFGDGASSTDQNPVHTFLSPGVYPVRLTIKEHDHWAGCIWVHYWNDPTSPLSTRTVNVTVSGTGPMPYKPLAIPGTIQAEDYNLGGEGVAYHDTTSANEGGAYRHDGVDIESQGGVTNVGWIRNGEFLTFTANVTTPGQFTMTARVASPNNGRTIAVSVDGASAATISVPNTGSFATFRTVSSPVTLEAGTHTLKLAFSGDGQNLDWIAFERDGVTTPTPVPSGGASFVAVPVTAPHGSAVRFTVTPANGKSIRSAWWSFDATAHLNTWNSRAVNPMFFYPMAGTFSPLVKLTYTDGSTETVQRTNYVRAA